ncbi:MAG TPA: iron transporter, partial [Solibacterales bacterium]|nr:iron transporter [Bryobacterales bacterium]
VRAYFWTPAFAALIIVLLFWTSYRQIVRVFKWLTLVLFAYVIAAFLAHPDWAAVLRYTFLPHLEWNSRYLSVLVGILGTTISPYLFFWQAAQEVEEEADMGRTRLAQRKGATMEELRAARRDVVIGMFFSNIVMYFIILTTAATLHAQGKTDISSATDAAAALQPLLGRFAELLFAVGIIGAGLLAIPVLTGSTGYTVSEAFGWRHGLDENVTRAKGFYGIIIASTVAGMLFNYLGLDPIKALVYSAVINGVTSPPLLFLIVMLSNRRTVMGEYTNRPWSNIFGWAAVLAMTAATIAYFVTFFV